MLTHKGTLPLETERLILRKFQLDDAEAMYRNWASDPEVARYLTWRAHSSPKVTRDLLESWCAHYTVRSYNWAIILKSSGEPVGSVGLVGIDEESGLADFGYALSRALWGQGVMPEAMERLLAYWFDGIGFRQIIGMHDVRNKKSGRVMEKLGMEKAERMPGGAKDNQGGAVDIQKWVLTRAAWAGRTGKGMPSVKDRVQGAPHDNF